MGLTQEQIDQIIARKDERPYAKLAKDLGVARCTIYQVLNKLKSDIQEKVTYTEYNKEQIALMYENTPTSIIAEKLGVREGYVRLYAWRLGVKKSAQLVREKQMKHLRLMHTLFALQNYQL